MKLSYRTKDFLKIQRVDKVIETIGFRLRRGKKIKQNPSDKVN